MKKTKLGDRVKDSITGLVGIVVARHEYLDDTTSLTIQPECMKDGAPATAYSFAEPRLVPARESEKAIGFTSSKEGE